MIKRTQSVPLRRRQALCRTGGFCTRRGRPCGRSGRCTARGRAPPRARPVGWVQHSVVVVVVVVVVVCLFVCLFGGGICDLWLLCLFHFIFF